MNYLLNWNKNYKEPLDTDNYHIEKKDIFKKQN